MPKRKSKVKRSLASQSPGKRSLASQTGKSFFRSIHLQAIAVLAVYFVISNLIFVGSVFHSNIYVSFLVPFIFGLISSFIFLYLFSHKDFFHFIGKFEREEKGKEKKYLGKFSRYGRITASILVSAIGGPIFLALTIRFLFPKYENRYLIAFISTLVSTIIGVAFAKGLFSFLT